jgi:hypothetical protein
MKFLSSCCLCWGSNAEKRVVTGAGPQGTWQAEEVPVAEAPAAAAAVVIVKGFDVIDGSTQTPKATFPPPPAPAAAPPIPPRGDPPPADLATTSVASAADSTVLSDKKKKRKKSSSPWFCWPGGGGGSKAPWWSPSTKKALPPALFTKADEPFDVPYGLLKVRTFVGSFPPRNPPAVWGGEGCGGPALPTHTTTGSVTPPHGSSVSRSMLSVYLYTSEVLQL